MNGSLKQYSRMLDEIFLSGMMHELPEFEAASCSSAVSRVVEKNVKLTVLASAGHRASSCTVPLANISAAG